MLFGLNDFTSNFGHEQDGLLFAGKLSTPPLSHEVARQESMIAARLFSPGFRKASEILTSRLPWICTGCNTKNEGICNDCEGCLANRPENSNDHRKHTKLLCDIFTARKRSVCPIACWDIHTPSSGQTPPPRQITTGCSQQTGGTHSTGMHTC